MVRNLKAIVFDLDDTLYPERQYVESGMRAVATWVNAQFGYPTEQTFEELLAIVARDGSGGTFNTWLWGKKLNVDDWLRPMVTAYRLHAPSISLHAGVPDLLARLRPAYRLGLVTDGHLAGQQCKVAALGLEALIEAIVYSDALGRECWKPSTRPYETILARLEIAAENAVYVGDNPAKDFRGARKLGMMTIRVRHRTSLRFQNEPPSSLDAPDVEIPDLSRLEKLLARASDGREIRL